jgi:cell division protein FtsB
VAGRARRLLRLLLITGGFLLPVIFWLALGERGLIRLYQAEMERQAYLEKLRGLAEENQALMDEVERLRFDLRYVESVARKELRLVGPNDVVYRLREEGTGSDGEVQPPPAPPARRGGGEPVSQEKPDGVNDR